MVYFLTCVCPFLKFLCWTINWWLCKQNITWLRWSMRKRKAETVQSDTVGYYHRSKLCCLGIPHTNRFCHTLPKPKIAPFTSPYLTQNYNSKYFEISSCKTYRSNQWRHLMFVKWNYTAHEKKVSKSIDFLKLSGRFQI